MHMILPSSTYHSHYLFKKHAFNTRGKIIYQNSHQRCYKKGVLKDFATITVKHLCQRCFLVIFTNFLRSSASQTISGRLLLRIAVFLTLAKA